MRSFGDTPYNWEHALRHDGFGGHFLPDIWVRAAGKQLGYVQHISSRDAGRTIIIGHFAVGVDFIGKGVSYVIIRELRARLIDHLGTQVVRFEEQHSKFERMKYERFFRAIGAINPDPRQPRVWTWAITQG